MTCNHVQNHLWQFYCICRGNIRGSITVCKVTDHHDLFVKCKATNPKKHNGPFQMNNNLDTLSTTRTGLDPSKLKKIPQYFDKCDTTLSTCHFLHSCGIVTLCIKTLSYMVSQRQMTSCSVLHFFLVKRSLNILLYRHVCWDKPFFNSQKVLQVETKIKVCHFYSDTIMVHIACIIKL